MPSNGTITPSGSTRNLCAIFDFSVKMYEPITSVYLNDLVLSIHDLRKIRNTLDSITAKTIAASLIHSTVVYCNSLSQPFSLST